MDHRRHLAALRSLNWPLLDQGLISGANFVTNLLLVRALGLEAYGAFALAWTVVLLVLAQQLAVVTVPMMALAPREGHDPATAFTAAALVAAILALGVILLGALVWMGADWAAHARLWRTVLEARNGPWLLPLVPPLVAALLALQFQEFARRLFFTASRPRRAFATDLIGHGARVALLLVVLPHLAHKDAEAALWLVAAAALLGGLSALPALGGHLRRPDSAALALTARHWVIGRWLSAGALAETVTSAAVNAVAATLLGTAAVGLLSATQTAVAPLNILLLGLSNVVPTEAGRRLARGAGEMVAYLRQVTLWGGLGVALLVGALSLSARFWLHPVFGIDPGPAEILVALWSLNYLIAFIYIPLRAGLAATEGTRWVFGAGFVKAVLLLALAWPALRGFGLPGLLVLFMAGALLDVALMGRGLRAELKSRNATPAAPEAVQAGLPLGGG